MKESTPYHHGDLRAALLKAARAHLALEGHEALSLRDLARQIGVARSAPYFHFKNREALLQALMHEGAADLERRYRAAADGAGAPAEKLAAACRSYVDFALRNRELFRLMFVSPVERDPALDAGDGGPEAVFDMLIAAVIAKRDRAAIKSAALACWCTLHGFAVLQIHGRVAEKTGGRSSLEAVIAAILRQIGAA